MQELGSWIEETIRRFVNSSANTLKNRTKEPAWAEPLVAFSSGDDPLYKFFKEDIGKFYLLPFEFFRRTFTETGTTADQLTVVSWILPQSEATKADNRKEKCFPSERWARARVFGEEVNDGLRRHLVGIFRQAGINAVAPTLSTFWKQKKSARYGYASTWSERHAAYVAGLGTFGLSDGLITPRGKAMRCGSVIAQTLVKPTIRQYTNHHAYCLFYAKRICGKCADRCPVGAISKDGHNKNLCSKHIEETKQYVKRHFRFPGYGCGLCQTGVPCESRIPEGLDK
jgi:ferredoxin